MWVKMGYKVLIFITFLLRSERYNVVVSNVDITGQILVHLKNIMILKWAASNKRKKMILLTDNSW